MRYLTSEIKEVYDKLDSIKDTNTLTQVLDNFMKTKFNLQYLWLLRKYFRLIKDINLKNFPSLLAGESLIYSMEGNLAKCKEYVEKIEFGCEERLYAEIAMPELSSEEFIEKINEVKRAGFKRKPYTTLTVGRPSVLNGFRDFSFFMKFIESSKDEFLEKVNTLYPDLNGEIIYKIVLAEKYYQENRLYDALMEIIKVIPDIEKGKDLNLMFAADFLEIKILLMSGQISSTTQKIEEIRKRMMETEHEEYIPNLRAAGAWFSMYDGDNEYVEDWIENFAPDDEEEFSMLNVFQYMVKMRIYQLKEKHLAFLALSGKLIPLLERARRHMDLCEIYMLTAISAWNNNDKRNSIEFLGKAVGIAQEYGYFRILGDEGERILPLLEEYISQNGETEFLRVVLGIAKEASEKNPITYVKKQTIKFTEKENQVFYFLDTQLTVSQIADSMRVSVPTVKFHLKNIYSKLGVKSREHAVTKARAIGYIN